MCDNATGAAQRSIRSIGVTTASLASVQSTAGRENDRMPDIAAAAAVPLTEQIF